VHIKIEKLRIKIAVHKPLWYLKIASPPRGLNGKDE